MRVLDVSADGFLDVAQGAVFNRASFEGASVSFRLPVERFSSCPFEDGEIVKVVWRGRTLLIGPVVKPDHSLSADAEEWSIKIYDYWWSLANIPYVMSGRSRGSMCAYKQGSSGEGAQNKQATAKVEDALRTVLDHAKSAALLPFVYDLRIDDGAELIPFAYASETYASLLVKVQKWRPNMSAWFEYGLDDLITLVVADYARIPEVRLDLSCVDVSSIELMPRPDLVPPAVGLTCNASMVSSVQRAVVVYPEGASLSQPYVVTAEVDVPDGLNVADDSGEGDPVTTGNLGYNAPVMIVRGDKLPSESDVSGWARRFKKWFPGFADCNDLDVGQGTVKITGVDVTDAEHRGYDANAKSHELVAGQINGKCGRIKWGMVHVEAQLRATNPPGNVKQYFPDHAGRVGNVDRWTGVVSVDVRTTNVSHARYRVDDAGTMEYDEGAPGGGGGGGTGGGGEGSYDASGLFAGVVRSIYDATRVLPYDGSLTIHDDFDHVSGGRLSLSGGLAEWGGMRSVIQDVSLDLLSGVSEVTVGCAEQLSLQDAIDKSKQLAEAMMDTSVASARTSSGSGSVGGDGVSGGIGGGGGGVRPEPDDRDPDLPSVGPYIKLGGPAELPAMGSSKVEVGFQCRLSYGSNGKVEKAYIRQGKAMYAGSYIGGMMPGDPSEGGWVSSPAIEGEIWIKITLDNKAKFMGAFLTTSGGETDPVQLGEEDRKKPYDYFFHLATIEGKKVIQHQAGTVYLQYSPGTFGPSGAA